MPSYKKDELFKNEWFSDDGFLGAPPVFCEHCGCPIEGTHCVLSSLDEEDFNRQFYVCMQCMEQRYVKQGKVAEC